MAKQTGNRLTDSKLRNIAPKSKPLTSSAVAGLVFYPSSSTKGAGAWVLRYYDNSSKKRTKMTLGHYPKMGIADAESEAKLYRSILKQGLNPKVEKQKIQDQELQKQSYTFEYLAVEYLNHEKAMGRWKNLRNAQSFERRLQMYVYPILANKVITEISIRDITELLKEIWNTKPSTATNVLSHIREIFEWANIMGYCEHNPCTSVRRALGKQKRPPEEESHQPSLDWKDIPLFFKTVIGQTRKSRVKYCLMFIILTACRKSAARLIQWGDIDFETNIWTLSPKREESKTLVNRYFPLSTQVSKLLSCRKNTNTNTLVFSRNGRKPLDHTSTKVFLNGHAKQFKSDIPGRCITTHGFRSTFKGWAVSMGYSDRLSELQLCHKYGNKIQRAYDRQPLIEERREMMQAWADYCLSEIKDFDSLF